MSSLRYGGQQASRRAVTFLIIGLAVAASVFLAAKAAAAAANRATGQSNGQPGLLVPNGGPGDPAPGEINPYRP